MGLAHDSGGAVPEPLSCTAEASLPNLTKFHEVVKMLKMLKEPLHLLSATNKAVKATTEGTDSVQRAEQMSQNSLVV